MAGIGFILRKLSQQDNLSGSFQAYIYSALIATGPWLFTIFALSSITIFAGRFVSVDVLNDFRRIVIYNFAFSLVLSSPVFMIVTRYLADRIYDKDVSGTPGLLLGSMFFLYVLEIPVVAVFYLYYSGIERLTAISAAINFQLISGIWLIAIFITAIKNYKTVIQAFAFGTIGTMAAFFFLAKSFGVIGIINSFSIGLSLIMAILISRIFIEYPYSFKQPFRFVSYFKKYWGLALSGLLYNLAVWIDKWIMWFAPEADKTFAKMPLYPDYDSAMFLAYLTVVPAMSYFVFAVETNFFEYYLKFYRDIQESSSLAKIKENHRHIMTSIAFNSRSVLILQGSICLVTILLAPHIFDILSISYMQIGMFRLGVLGALFQVFSLFLTILLSYFDNRMAVLKIQLVFFLSNTGFSLLFLTFGFKYYGYGYFLATLVTFIVSVIITMKYVNHLIFHTFVTANASIK